MDAYGKIWNERRMMIRERVLEEVPPGAELADETLQAMIDRTITELFRMSISGWKKSENYATWSLIRFAAWMFCRMC